MISEINKIIRQVKILKKIKALIRYEMIDLRRSPIVWVILILYAIGVQQDFSGIFFVVDKPLTLFSFIVYSWLPLNFIMIPVLLVNMNIGYNSNEIFNTMDISPSEIMLSKILTLILFDGIILLSNITIFVIVAILCKVSLGYMLHQFLGYFVNTIIFLIVCSALGLFFGRVISRYVGTVISSISTVILFLLLCNFYKTNNSVFPLIDLNVFAKSFDVIRYDNSYFYHNALWLVLAIIMVLLSFKFKNKLMHRSSLVALLVISVYLGGNIFLFKPTFYDITIRAKVQDGDNLAALKTYFSDKNVDYHVDKYKMDLKIGDNFENNCEMEILVSGNSVKSIELGLFEKLEIKSLEVDGEKLSFTRTNKSFKVNLPKEYKKGEIINLKVQYAGIINTVWWQGQASFHSTDNSIFLADVFEWYPKQNDEMDKKYDINIKYSGKNKIYSNLKQENKSGEYKLTGEDKEIFLVSNKMVERKYKTYLLVGNEENINNDKWCEQEINYYKTNNIEDKKTIIFALSVPGGIFGQSYKNAALDSVD